MDHKIQRICVKTINQNQFTPKSPLLVLVWDEIIKKQICLFLMAILKRLIEMMCDDHCFLFVCFPEAFVNVQTMQTL